MNNQLVHSMFHDVYFPKYEEGTQTVGSLRLQKTWRFIPSPEKKVVHVPWVVFDFETTGLNAKANEIVEVGAIKYVGETSCERYSTLVKPKAKLTYATTKITGITASMLADKPSISDVLDDFLAFIKGSILIAHNAEFDAGFLHAACTNNNYEIDCPIYCTLKMARQILPNLESRSLDALAEHYQLSFAERHRSIGDAEVTGEVFKKMLDINTNTLQELEPFRVKQCP